jgi:hypothetical protein
MPHHYATTSMPHWSFESLRAAVIEIPEPPSAEERETLWVVPRQLGVARGRQGSLEVFLVGARLIARTGAVRRHMDYGTWATATDDQFDANRLVLPSEPHFVAIAALIALELLRAGLGTESSDQEAFTDVEPLIELALLRGALTEESVLGLVGELLVLEKIMTTIAGESGYAAEAIDMWRGHLRGERDFRIGSTGVEVKTTQHLSSTHAISSIRQVELVKAEDELYLLSLGLAATSSGGQTLPDIVQRLLDLLDACHPGSHGTQAKGRLLRQVSATRHPFIPRVSNTRYVFFTSP